MQKELNDEAVEEIKQISGVITVSPAYELGGKARMGRKQGHLQLIGIDTEVMNKLEFEGCSGSSLTGRR